MSNRRIHPADWNGWQLLVDTPAFVYEPYGYRIDLEQMATTYQIVFWVMQIHHKNWPDGAVHGLIAAIDDVLDPQDGLNGPDPAAVQAFTQDAIRRKVAAFTANPTH